MTISIPSGADLIGANFLLDWIANGDEPVVNPGSLVYAESREGWFGNDAALNVLGCAAQLG